MTEVIELKRGPKSVHTASIAMTLFLLSWAMTFVSLFVAYVMIRVKQPAWPPAGQPDLPLLSPLVNTVVAVASSLAYHSALKGARTGRQPQLKRGLIGAGVLGLVFLALQTQSWVSLWSQGLKAGTSTYAGMFYTLTWFHAAHVAAALLILLYVIPMAYRGRYTVRDHLPVKLTAWFWHFVTAAWLCVLVAVYIF